MLNDLSAPYIDYRFMSFRTVGTEGASLTHTIKLIETLRSRVAETYPNYINEASSKTYVVSDLLK